MADQFREAGAVARAFELAWAHSQVEHRHRDWSAEEAHLFQRLASHIIFAGSALRAEPSVAGRATAWASPASGGTASRATGRSSWCGSPAATELPLARQLLAAHAYLRLTGLEFDLVLLDEEPGSYLDELNQQLLETVRAERCRRADRPAGRRLRAQGVADERGRAGPAPGGRAGRPGRRPRARWPASSTGPSATPRCPRRLAATREPGRAGPTSRSRLPDDLLFDNGLGGFTPDGREYCVLVQGPPPPDGRPQRPGRPTTAPRLAPAAPAGPLGQRRRQPGRSASWSPRRARASPGPATARSTG